MGGPTAEILGEPADENGNDKDKKKDKGDEDEDEQKQAEAPDFGPKRN